MTRLLSSLIVILVLTGIVAGCMAGTAPAPSEQQHSSRPLAQEGQMCAGFAGIACASGLSCQMAAGQCRTVADAAGVCRKPPQACTREFRQVCGCDGKTYSNPCVAASAGVSVAAEGACSAT